MKKVLALVAISGMATFYACSNSEKQEETTTEQTSAPADSTQQAAPADTAHHAEGQH
jgi:hypothetical protein